VPARHRDPIRRDGHKHPGDAASVATVLYDMGSRNDLPAMAAANPFAERLRAGAERAHGLDGALAAALERVARIAATSLRAPAAAVVLLGQDRRCFSGGDAHLW